MYILNEHARVFFSLFFFLNFNSLVFLSFLSFFFIDCLLFFQKVHEKFSNYNQKCIGEFLILNSCPLYHFVYCVYCTIHIHTYCICICRMFQDRWYKRAEGDSTCKNESKEKTINFKSFKASSSNKSSLKIYNWIRVNYR